jgi:hypothetical protein
MWQGRAGSRQGHVSVGHSCVGRYMQSSPAVATSVAAAVPSATATTASCFSCWPTVCTATNLLQIPSAYFLSSSHISFLVNNCHDHVKFHLH